MEGFDLLNILQEQLASLLNILPNLVGALAVFIIGWIISRLAANFVKRILRTIGVDKLAEKLNEIEIVYKSKIKVVPSIFLSKLLYYLLLFIFINAATYVLGMQAISDLMTEIINYVPSLISALIVLVLGIVVADFLKSTVLTACTSLGIPAGKLIANVVFYFIFLNVIMMALKQASLQTTFMENNISIILAGFVLAFAIGYGFASRSLLASLLAAFYNKGKVNVGDRLRIDDVEGEVIEIDSTSLILKSTRGRRIIIPLSRLTAEKYEILEN